MTILKLHRILSKMIANGQARRKVCIRKDTFRHVLEPDGVVYIDVADVFIQAIEMADDDGGIKTLSNGKTQYQSRCVLAGDYAPEE